MPFVQFQKVQIYFLECDFYWSHLRRTRWAGDHLCHLKEWAGDSQGICLQLTLDTTESKNQTDALWTGKHVFHSLFVFSYLSQFYIWMRPQTDLELYLKGQNHNLPQLPGREWWYQIVDWRVIYKVLAKVKLSKGG